MNHLTRTVRSLASVATAATILAGSFAVSVAGTAVAVSPCTVTEAGSTTVQPALDAAKPAWQGLAATGNCTITIGAQGSGGGLDILRAFNAQVAASSRPLGTDANTSRNAPELANLWSWKVGEDAMVIQVSDSANMSFITQITAAQVNGIWSGTITNWNQFPGGPNQPIINDCRSTASGSRSDFIRLFGIVTADEVANCKSRLQTAADDANAAKTDYHIVYTSLANVGVSGTKELRLSGGAPITTGIGNASTFVTPTANNVSNGTYPAPRELFLVVNKFSTLPANTNTTNTAYVKGYDFVNYMFSSAGQAAVSSTGFVTVSPRVIFPASDVNLDGFVSLPDLGQITGRWNQADAATPGWVRADANRDGVITLPDIGVVTSKWGASPASGFVFVAPS